MTDDTTRWNAKLDAYRPTSDFSDLLKIVACYYEMYSKAATFLGPWIAKQHGKDFFIPPDKDQLKEALGKERPAISFRARSAFVEALQQFLIRNKGKKTLITPNPSSHHSAQFPSGTFTISKVSSPIALRDDRGPRAATKGPLYKIELLGSESPIYVENLTIPAEQIGFMIVRPKLGKLGTASVNRWEVLMFKTPYGYLVEHVDSNLNPRYSGIM